MNVVVEVASDVAVEVVSHKCKGLVVVRSTVEVAVEENLVEVVEGGHNMGVVVESKQAGAGVMVKEVEASILVGVVGEVKEEAGVESKLVGVVKVVEVGESRLVGVVKEGEVGESRLA